MTLACQCRSRSPTQMRQMAVEKENAAQSCQDQHHEQKRLGSAFQPRCKSPE